jgi:signal transduction histidine kinase
MPAALLGAGVPLAVLAGGELYQSGWHAPHGAGNWATAGMGVVVVATWFMVGMTLDRLFTVRAANEALIAELRASQEQLQHAAEQERELALLRERERLARDLHDVVGNALVLAAVKLEAAQRLARADRERACAELDATKHLLRRTMTELRAAVTSLRSAPGDDRPLDVALAEDARELTRDAGVRLWLACPAIEGLTPAQDEALRRVAREALMNLDKHARASEVGVSLEDRDGRVTLEITDNGRGLPPDSTQAGHYGLCGMRERMELVGGRLALLPRPGGGLCVRAELPLAASAAAALVSHAAD